MEEPNYKVYCHTCKSNGKQYVGMTKAKLKSRFGKNGNGYKECVLFFYAINKYGWEDFKSELLFDKLSFDEAEDMETKMIRELNTMSPSGYNLQSGGGGNRMVSQYTRDKMSKSGMGKVISEEQIEKTRIALTGQKRTPKQVENIRRGQLGKTLTEEHKANITKGLLSNTNRKFATKEIKQFTLDGEYIRNWVSTTVASKELGLDRRGIGKASRGEQNQSGGFKWEMICHNGN